MQLLITRCKITINLGVGYGLLLMPAALSQMQYGCTLASLIGTSGNSEVLSYYVSFMMKV